MTSSEQLVLYGLPAASALLCYLNSLHGELVYDDIPAVRDNRDVRAETSSLWTLATDDYWGRAMSDNTSHKSYRPVRHHVQVRLLLYSAAAAVIYTSLLCHLPVEF